MNNLEKHIVITEAVCKAPNLTDRFSKKDLETIAQVVYAGFEQDKLSRQKWEHRTEAAMNLAMQIVKAKSFPWDKCANVAFPLVTIAALQFHSQAYPAIIQSTDVCKYIIIGDDADGKASDRARRIGAHMSYQLLVEDQPWEEGQDRLLLSVPIVGCAFKKTYYSNGKQHNVSELVLAHDLVMDYYAKSVEDCARKTQIIPMYRNEIYEMAVAGAFKDVRDEPWFTSHAVPMVTPHDREVSNREGTTQPVSDSDTPFTVLEQHCLLDLDGDGYKEPYIATIEYNSRTLLRLTTRFGWKDIDKTPRGEIIRIRAEEYFTKYSFIPSPDGSIYDIGFGVLLGPINESTNTILNQLLDAGTLATTGGGFLARGAKLRGGKQSFAPFEWKNVDTQGDDLRKSVFPLPVSEPSNVLFQLLSLLINYTGRVSGTTETMVGENPGQNTPAGTTQTMVEQGMKVYKAIFKRIWRGMRAELNKLYILNAKYLPPDPIQFGTPDMYAQRIDYEAPPAGIVPVADPNVVSENMRFQIATAVKQAATTTNGYDKDAVERNWLRALHVEGAGRLFPGSDKVQPMPNPKIAVEQMKLQAKQMDLEFEKMKFAQDLMEQRKLNQAKIVQLMADAALKMEQAGGVKTGHEIAAFEAAIGALKLHNEQMNKQLELLMKGMENEQAQSGGERGAVQGMASGPSDGGGAQDPAAQMGAGGEGQMG